MPWLLQTCLSCWLGGLNENLNIHKIPNRDGDRDGYGDEDGDGDGDGNGIMGMGIGTTMAMKMAMAMAMAMGDGDGDEDRDRCTLWFFKGIRNYIAEQDNADFEGHR